MIKKDKNLNAFVIALYNQTSEKRKYTLEQIGQKVSELGLGYKSITRSRVHQIIKEWKKSKGRKILNSKENKQC